MTTLSKSDLPHLKFLLSHPSHFIALGFGTGLARLAPGTVGTLVGLPLFYCLIATPELVHYTTIAVLFFIGIPICTKTGKSLGVADHGSIVWDEIVAMMLVLEFTPQKPIWWLVAFTLFRLFDVWKPFPIRQCDTKLKGGFGVMFDDLLAAIYAIVTLKVMLWSTMNYSN
jgi:phosphatidylglycerophosphatase A